MFPEAKDYQPTPVDSSGIQLDEDLERLIELLARNAHDIWARTRLAQGWVHGEQRDDARKHHPCLVPYEQLSESEKEYDKELARGTLEAIAAFGYELSRPATSVADRQASLVPDDEQIGAVKAQLEQGSLDLRALAGIWRGHSEEQWAAHASLHSELATRLLERGSPLLAHEVASTGLKYWPRNVRLRQLLALALARSGATRCANELLRRLYEEGDRSSETQGILARTHKDLAYQSTNIAVRQHQLHLAHTLYLNAFRNTGETYPGINAAMTAHVLGQRELARALAREVQARCEIELVERRQQGKACYYQLATLGETALILSDRADAERWYTSAIEVASGRFGDLSSTRRNARLISQAMEGTVDWIDALFDIPRVVVFVGHAIDRGDRPHRRFPPEAEGAVRDAISERLTKLNSSFGFASAASGGDLLFLEALAERGGQTHIVLPYDPEQFVEDSVAYVEGSDWTTRFRLALARASEVVVATGHRFAAGGALHDYANLLLLGFASLRARDLETELVPIALWDGDPEGPRRGTGSVVAQWQALGHTVEVIPMPRTHDPGGNRSISGVAADIPGGERDEATTTDLDTRIMGILFADVLNFSNLSDAEIPLFVNHFLGAIDALASQSGNPPLVRNTWGDGLYFAFGTVRDAGVFALDLCEMVARADWRGYGLREDLNVRVAVHAGPLFACVDPVTRSPTFTGRHVVRAARLEPVTPPGLVYATRDFAALAAAYHVGEFSCEPVGQLAMAKEAGMLQVYVLTRNCDDRPGGAAPESVSSRD